MEDFLESIMRGTRRVLEDPKFALPIYLAALVGVLLTVWVETED